MLLIIITIIIIIIMETMILPLALTPFYPRGPATATEAHYTDAVRIPVGKV